MVAKAKTVLVTGAAGGQGRASAEAFGRRGATVIAVDLDEDGAAETAARIDKDGGQAHVLAADLRHEDQVSNLVDTIISRFDHLDAAHNNAGVYQRPAPTAELGLDEWNRLIDANLTATFLCMKHELRVMGDAGRGVIVNTCSRAGLHGLPGSAAYSAAMHGVVGLTQTAAIEYGPQGIRVNAICAGGIETPALRLVLTEAQLAAVTNAYPLGRLGTPDEMAAAAVWLCSDEATFITGATLLLDGGAEAR